MKKEKPASCTSKILTLIQYTVGLCMVLSCIMGFYILHKISSSYNEHHVAAQNINTAVVQSVQSEDTIILNFVEFYKHLKNIDAKFDTKKALADHAKNQKSLYQSIEQRNAVDRYTSASHNTPVSLYHSSVNYYRDISVPDHF